MMEKLKRKRIERPANDFDLENREQQVNQYDKLIKENMEASLESIIRNVLKIDIVSSEEIPDDIQHTKERKPDLLKKVTDTSGETYILHLEYQVQNDDEMIYRMHEYRAMLLREYGLTVKQFVIYLGKAKNTMITEINQEDLTFRYHLLSIFSIDYKTFLNSVAPEVQIMAILANFNEESIPEVLANIVKTVKASSKGEFAKNRLFKHLRILSQLRTFNPELLPSIMETIDKYIKMERDPFYLVGEKKGEAIGEARGEAIGEARGEAKGKQENQDHVIKNMIVKLGLSDQQIVAATEAAIEYVRKIRESLKK